MYTLRTISKDGDINRFLGSVYSLITKEHHTENFLRIKQERGFEEYDNIFAFIQHESGDHTPLFSNTHYYIVSSDGRTFNHYFFKE